MEEMIDFKSLCSILEQVRAAKGFNEKSNILSDFFKTTRSTLQKDKIFPILRLIVPKLDRERQSYHMKESRVARVLIKMLALPNGNDKSILTKSYLMAGQASDFGDVVYSVIRKYISNYKTVLTIDDLNKYLDDIANRKTESDAEDVMLTMFRKSSPENVRWLIRIILKEMKLGIDSNRILNAYHRDGASFYASNNSLRKVCEVLSDTKINLHEIDIEIFEAFRPMLSKRVDAATFKKSFHNGKRFYIENKFDGERFQLHMQDGRFKYFSRNGFDFTSTYGENYNQGIFTPKLDGIFNPSIRKIILDGEMMLWNKFTKKFGSKGMTLDVKKLRSDGRYQPCFCIYDIILLNEKILTNKPLVDRKNILQKVFNKEIPGTILLSKISEVHSQKEIIQKLNDAVNLEEEGIIVKDPNSIYKYSDRNSGWYKMKLEYFQDVMTDLDLIVMGGNYASSTSDTINSFFVGVRSGTTDSGQPIYLSFGKVSSGLKDDQLEMLNKKLKTEGHPFENFDRNKDDTLLFGKEVPKYYIKPEKSLIFVVRATELVRATGSSFKTSYTLRFPRVLNVRDDKPVDECLSMNELLELCNQNKQVIKLNKRNIDLEEILNTRTKKMKIRQITITKSVDSTKVSDLLEEYTIYILNGNEEHSKEDIEAYVKRAGGKIAYRIDEKVDIVLVGTYDDKVKAFTSKRSTYDVISIEWLKRVMQDGNLLGYDTEEILCLGMNYKNCLSDEVDIYGDSFTKEATTESLKYCFGIINNLNETPKICATFRKQRRFDNCTAYFDKYKVVNEPTSEIIYDSFLDEMEFRFQNDEVTKVIGETVNFIIYNGEPDRCLYLRDYLKNIGCENIKTVSKHFIYNEDAR